MAKIDDDTATATAPATPPAAAPHVNSAWRANWWLLGIASAALAAALGYALTRDDVTAPPAATAGAATAGGTDVAALEARVRANPDDAEGWALLGEAKFVADEFGAAVEAYARATTLAPGVSGYWSAYGEAQVLASRAEPMPAPAVEAFRTANRLDPRDPRARYFLAVKRDIDGDHQGAITDLLALLTDTPTGAPWEANLRQTVTQIGQINSISVADRLGAVQQRALAPAELPVAARAIPGPTPQQMRDGGALPKGQQDMMVQGMVDGLETRLTENPRQPDRWIMLMRSRMTLGEGARAAEALRRAIAANPAEADRLRAQARLLRVPGA